MIDLTGHNVLVTGSTQGVGQAIVIAMANAGANVVLHGLRNDETAQTALQQCRSTGVDAHLLTLDLATHAEQAAEQLFDEARQLNPNIDILVNNAGTYIDQPFLEMDFATFDKTMQLNVYAGFFLTQRFSQRWVQDSINGRVLFIGSINGKLAEPVHTAYDTSKGAIESMVKTLAVSLAPHNIRVNGLAPGLFYTPLTAPALDDPDFMQWMKNHTPNGQVPGPEVCGDGAVYLVSDAAQHVCGHMLMVDGGMSIWQQPDL
ncbi:MAG: SDR family oxidoreductase [Planctomycetota bacterium]|nr:SDR family oxidoreductase [Planctomycetota bacterium]